MAEDKQGKTAEPAKKTIDQPDNNQGNRDGILNIIKTFLPAIGVFAALIYFFGRLYIEEYYYALGISPDVLTFSTEDYMFSSFNVVIMCLVFSILFYLCWGGILFTQIKEEKGFAFVVSRRPTTFLFIVLAWFLGIIYYLYFHFSPDLYVTGLSGLATGLVYGVGLIMVVVIIRAITKYIDEKYFIFQWVIGVILAFSIMPWITTDLASAQAKSDEYGFHDVRIISKENLHCQMQSATSNLTDCFDGKLIITNNGVTYVVKMIEAPPNTDCRTVSLSAAGPKKYLTVSEIRKRTDDFTLCRLVYAIPVESIKNIIYYTQK